MKNDEEDAGEKEVSHLFFPLFFVFRLIDFRCAISMRGLVKGSERNYEPWTVKEGSKGGGNWTRDKSLKFLAGSVGLGLVWFIGRVDREV